MPYNFISVIVPAHNEQKYISQCLKSLIAQDYSKDRYEIIVVDNDSRDRTQEIVKKLNVRIIEQNTGPVGAVRNGLQKDLSCYKKISLPMAGDTISAKALSG